MSPYLYSINSIKKAYKNANYEETLDIERYVKFLLNLNEENYTVNRFFLNRDGIEDIESEVVTFTRPGNPNNILEDGYTFVHKVNLEDFDFDYFKSITQSADFELDEDYVKELNKVLIDINEKRINR